MTTLVLAVVLWVQAPALPGRLYHRVTVEQLASGSVKWPHAIVRGRVRLVRGELDSDQHIKLTGRRAAIVLECIPELPCEKPPVGAMIVAWGIVREDREHGWWELHPLEGWRFDSTARGGGAARSDKGGRPPVRGLGTAHATSWTLLRARLPTPPPLATPRRHPLDSERGAVLAWCRLTCS